MTETTGKNGISNFKLMKKEELSPLKSEDDISSDGTVSSDNMIENGNFDHTIQNMLPLKKRSGGSFETSNINLIKEPAKNTNPWIKLPQKQINATNEEAKNELKHENQKTQIFPGVIRHTYILTCLLL